MVGITLTTDWRKHDFYSGMIKGRLLRLIPQAQLIEVADQIEPFHVLEGAFILRQVMHEFPENTIHLFSVNQGNLPDVYPVVLKMGKGGLIAWENTAADAVFGSETDYCLRVTPEVFAQMKKVLGISNNKVYPSFPELGLFPVMAKVLADGLDLTEFGPSEPELLKHSPWIPVIQEQSLTGHIIYLDSYGNAITNISNQLFNEVGQGRKFEILLVHSQYRITSINTAYLETEPGEILGLFNSLGLLELAQVHGNLAELWALETGTTIKVKFRSE